MSDFFIWKEKNKTYLYDLYKIFLDKVENFKAEIRYLNSLKDEKNISIYNLPNENLNMDYYHSEEFIQQFIYTIYQSSSKKVSYFD